MCAPESSCYQAIAYYYYIQYNLHIQLLEAGNYARQKGIIFKGDIPIGISRNSVEAWIEPYYFNMNGQAGAPPDPFSDKGQNWGFPTYNWDVMEQDNYQWWQNVSVKWRNTSLHTALTISLDSSAFGKFLHIPYMGC